MADFENSKTLPAITRRNPMNAATAALIVLVEKTAFETNPSLALEHVDPTVALWRDWFVAYRRTNRLCRRQQRLERKLFDACGGFPHVMFNMPGQDEPISAGYAFQIDKLPGDSPEVMEIKARAKAELRERNKAWRQADAVIGYERARAIELKAGKVQEKLAKALWKTPAHTLPGVIAKLHCVIESEAPGPRNMEEPWPQLRAILGDLLRMDSASLAC